MTPKKKLIETEKGKRNTGQVNPMPTQECVRSVEIVGRWVAPDRSSVPIVVLESELAIELEVACDVLLVLSSSPPSLPSSPSSSAKRVYDPALNPEVPCFASALKREDEGPFLLRRMDVTDLRRSLTTPCILGSAERRTVSTRRWALVVSLCFEEDVDPVEGLDILEKREELGEGAPLDSDEVVISSGGRISANVRGGGVSSPCGIIAGRVDLRGRAPDHKNITLYSTTQTQTKGYHNTPLSIEENAPSLAASSLVSCPIGVITPPYSIPGSPI